jgi:uncharacterized lipoprotein YmbA
MKRLVVLATLWLAGCTLLTPTHDASRFYTLAVRDAASPSNAAARGRAPSVVVGPVSVPAYLDRNEVAVRVSSTEIRYTPTERWAEPLATNFSTVLAEDLGTALGSDRVVPQSAAAGIAPDFFVEVVVVRFEAGTDGSAQLTARWAVRDKDRKILTVRQTQHARQATSATTEGGVKALSAALADLADEIATAIRSSNA